ncbi:MULTISPECIES: hypothetical protein [unclassified Nostoc]|uniref:hypothetical protein n=1 Tax=unclassified Nostoc TaxID=2593658 RepID=UPI002AD52CC6|nr:hypothetical protein [Nostoc sp. DedQUE03]MDZ7974462.1 hypothetical protein [Nostoc sp. DedQUE03]MDZ8047134.1 hypothetical protein [Nostoc sp. DedQUE02]
MSNDKQLCVYALFWRFSARRSLTFPQQAMPSLPDVTRTAGLSTRGYANAYALLGIQA